MTPTGFRNGQDESRCYVNSSFQVLFFNIYFRRLIMDFYCEYYRTYGQQQRWLGGLYSENHDTASHSTDFCEMLIGGSKIVNSDMCFGVTNTKTNVQNNSSDF